MSKGENILVHPLPLMTKGESDLGFPSSPKGEIVGIMTQVLSLMETHSQVSLILMRGTHSVTDPFKCNKVLV